MAVWPFSQRAATQADRKMKSRDFTGSASRPARPRSPPTHAVTTSRLSSSSASAGGGAHEPKRSIGVPAEEPGV